MILIKTVRLLNKKKTKLQFFENYKKSLLNSINLNDYALLKRADTKNNPTLKQNLINFIIKFNITLTNTFVSVTDTKGNLKLSISAGKLSLKRRQKVTQPNALIQILKSLFLKAKFLHNQTVELQFKNTKTYHELLILNNLKKNFL